jgi:hypothetical protein
MYRIAARVTFGRLLACAAICVAAAQTVGERRRIGWWSSIDGQSPPISIKISEF